VPAAQRQAVRHACDMTSSLALLYLLAGGPVAGECVGKENSPYLPAEYVELGAWVVGSEHSVSLACRRDDPRWTLFLMRNVATEDSRVPRWVARVTLIIPRLRSGFTLASDCLLAGQKDPEVIAVVRETRSPRFVSVQRAWRADTQHDSFVEIPTNGISCVNEASD
jgi:hypothetical protein